MTKQTRNDFMRWLIINYGYNREDITDNTRVLSDKYYKESKIRIPKYNIYRWLKQLQHFANDEYQNIASNYISESVF